MTTPAWFTTFLLCALAELVSLLTWFAPELGPAAFGVFAGVAVVIALRNPGAGFLLLAAEAIIGGHGHMLSYGPITIRMALFGSVTLGWLIEVFRSRDTKRTDEIPLLAPLAAVVLAVGWGVMRGLAAGHSTSDVLNDANGYAFILAIPMAFDLFRDRVSLSKLGEVFAGAVLWLSIKSILLLYLFSHSFGPVLGDLWLWQRRDWLSEITSLGRWQRVFSASDVFLVPAVILGTLALWKTRARRSLAVVLPVAAFVISFSRSLWVGTLAGVAAAAPAAWRAGLLDRKNSASLAAVALGVTTLALVVLAATVFFPWPAMRTYGTSRIDSRLFGTDAAVSSRWNMLPPLEKAIGKRPILGGGFGSVITYRSDDPRIIALYKDGVITTGAIEWQYLEIWMKMGLPGLIAIFWLFAVIGQRLWKVAEKERDGIVPVAAFASFIALVVLNVFTPYINHPLGWMSLALILVASRPCPDGR